MLSFKAVSWRLFNHCSHCSRISSAAGVDFQPVDVTAYAVCEYSFTWSIPNVAGTYVVEVGLVPAQMTAYDAAWLAVTD